MTTLRVVQPGLLSLLQDGGRQGCAALGLTTGGPMDPVAARLANRLLQNKHDATLIEVSFGGLHLETNEDVQFVVTGASLPLTANDRELSLWTVQTLRAGETLCLGYSELGCRSYLALRGGLDIKPSFGSTATVVRESIGGLNGKRLDAGDALPVHASSAAERLWIPPERRPVYHRRASVRVIEGYQHRQFPRRELRRFYGSEYTVSQSSDRMGYRLDGASIACNVQGILSEGIVPGAIQVPADGQPIVLLNDRQTIGGYPKLGSALSIDCASLAQLRPGDAVNFTPVSIQTAHNALHLTYAFESARRLEPVPVMTAHTLSLLVEKALVARNLRGMAQLQPVLEEGYCLRAATTLSTASRVIIGTGFPVEDTFETDGPLGAIALYRALTSLGIDCYIACAAPLAIALRGDYQILELQAFDTAAGKNEARERLEQLTPDAVVSIERPGLADDQRYYNMLGEDISPRCAVFDYYLTLAPCPTIAVGDGGNEIGMGKVREQVAALSIKGAATSCDELLVADVSNWGAYALIGLLEVLSGKALLDSIEHRTLLEYLSERGSVDGVTRENTLTEDGLPASAGEDLIETLKALLAQFYDEERRRNSH